MSLEQYHRKRHFEKTSEPKGGRLVEGGGQNLKKPAASERPDLRIRRPSTPSSLDPSRLAGARRAAMPEKIAPELPTLVEKVPEGTGWLHELKFDA
jgi:bifunctional non-homologous end joining protein LigD